MSDHQKTSADVICERCLAANSVSSPSCRNCAAPLTTPAINDPIRQIRAEGDLLRNAQRARRSWVVQVGIILLCAPVLLAPIVFVAAIFFSKGPVTATGRPSEYMKLIFWTLLLLLATGFFALIYGKVLIRTLRNQWTNGKDRT